MDFFSHQAKARKQTRRMLVLFTLAVIAIVLAVDGVLYWLLQLRHLPDGRALPIMVGTSLAVVALIGVSTLYRVATLRGGGDAVARQLGGVEVPPDTVDFAYRRLRNVVEEVAIAAGVPVPEVFVLEHEGGINAFAAGYAPTDAAVAVTRGALDKLTREELQGVIAHEFSHVLNGDMRLNIQLMGVAFGILSISLLGHLLARTHRGIGGRGRDNSVAMLGFALILVGSIGVFFARLIKAAVSRQREFLADASAVQFTRSPQGIAGALKKIAGLSEGSRLEATGTEEVSHMLFGDGAGRAALFATHPSVLERIARIDRTFKPDELTRIAAAWSAPVRAADAAQRDDVSISGMAPVTAPSVGKAPSTDTMPASGATVQLSPAVVSKQVGSLGEEDQQVAHAIHESIAPSLIDACHDRQLAPLVVLALLLDEDAPTRTRQLAHVADTRGAAARDQLAELHGHMRTLHPMLRLPLAALTFPVLRRHSRQQLQSWLQDVNALIQIDQHVTLGEYCLARLIQVRVMEALDPSAHRQFGRIKVHQVRGLIAQVLAVVAQYGNDSEATARQAFTLGMQEILPRFAAPWEPPLDWRTALDEALPQLDRLAPAGKELLVRGLTRAIAADGRVSVVEAELLRTICASLHCPLPALLQQAAPMLPRSRPNG